MAAVFKLFFCSLIISLIGANQEHPISQGRHSESQPNQAETNEEPEEIILTAVELARPILRTVSEQSHTLAFGAENSRAARSSDVTIMNTSNRRFILQSTSCKCGGFSSNMFPADQIHPNSNTIFGVQSYGFLTGLRCKVEYAEVDNGSSFIIGIANPYFGKNWAWFENKGPIKIVDVVGKGNNNHFRFDIRDDVANSEATFANQ